MMLTAYRYVPELIGPRKPIADRLGRGLELLGELLQVAAGACQFDPSFAGIPAGIQGDRSAP